MIPWTQKSTFSTVNAIGDRVFKRGKIFQAGEYPDKNITVTVENLREGAAKFTPCPLNIEHWHSVLDDKLGELVSIDVQDDGAVYGVVSIPRALAELFGDDPIPVSIELRHDDWVIYGLAFAKHPRVPDAAVFAACGIDNMPDKNGRGTKTMSWYEKFKQSMRKAVEELPDDVEQTGSTGGTSATGNDVTAQLSAEIAARQKAESDLAAIQEEIRVAKLAAETEKLEAAGKAFAEHYVRERRILPGQLESVATSYKHAVNADAVGKSAFGADGKIVEGDAVKNLRALMDGMTQHNLTQEQMAGKFTAIPGDNPGTGTGTGEVSEERRKELFSSSTLGKRAAQKG